MPKPVETALLVSSDVHYGKKTASYDRSICRERFMRLGQKMAELHAMLSPAYRFDRLVVVSLGDANDGTGIYPGQENYQDSTNAELQAKELAALWAEWSEAQVKLWKRVDWECVPGNHGRSGRFAHEAASWDLVAYRYLAGERVKGVTVGVNDEPDDMFIRKIEIRGHVFLLHHGHEIPMYMKKPWYGICDRVKNWAVTESLGGFEVVLLGHFHQLGMDSANAIDVYTTGTMATGDFWARRRLGAESPARWWLLFIGDRYPVTHGYALRLA